MEDDGEASLKKVCSFFQSIVMRETVITLLVCLLPTALALTRFYEDVFAFWKVGCAVCAMSGHVVVAVVPKLGFIMKPWETELIYHQGCVCVVVAVPVVRVKGPLMSYPPTNRGLLVKSVENKGPSPLLFMTIFLAPPTRGPLINTIFFFFLQKNKMLLTALYVKNEGVLVL